MKVFELQFNPRPQRQQAGLLGGRAKNKEDKIIKSFIYEPAGTLEKRLGNLYMAGELNQTMSQNADFLANLASVIQKEYYSAGLNKSHEQSLQESLKKANDFLDIEVRKGNVNWLGNLSFAVINFNDFAVNFTEAGDIKIFLIKNGELLDISQNLEAQKAENYSSKVFSNIVTGKLAQNDKVVVINKNVFSALIQEKDFLRQLGQMADEKDLKEILKRKKPILSEVSGVCLLLLVNEESATKQTLTLYRDAPQFSFRQTFIKPIAKLKPSIKLSSFKLPKVSVPRLKIPQIRVVMLKKKLTLILALMLILTACFFIFRGEKEKEFQEAQQKITEAQSKIIIAESLLILGEKNKAQALFQESWDIINPLTKAGMPLRNEAASVKKSLEKYLK